MIYWTSSPNNPTLPVGDNPDDWPTQNTGKPPGRRPLRQDDQLPGRRLKVGFGLVGVEQDIGVDRDHVPSMTS